MRWIRFLSILISSRFRSKLRLNEESRIAFRVWLTDIDASIMNHAALMTVMETGRIDFMVRTGFFTLARKNKWYFPSSSIYVQFFRPLKLFQRATVITRAFHINEKWVYLEQKVIRNEKLVAACVVRSTVKKARQQLDVLDVVRILNIGDPPVEGMELIASLEKIEQQLHQFNA